MSVANDIKKALKEVGVEYRIIRDSGNVSGEYLDYETNAQVTKPFIREFFLEVELPYDTSLEAGDVVEIIQFGEKYMVMLSTPDALSDTIVALDGVFYKCNVSGELMRISGESRGSRYERTYVWDTVRSNCYGLMTEMIFGQELEIVEDLAAIAIERDELYIPKSVGVEVGDRYQYASGEYRMVETVQDHRFPAADVAKLGEDTR
jgi:hypothetical protein